MNLGPLIVNLITQLVLLGAASSGASTFDFAPRADSAGILLSSNPGGPLLLAAGVLGDGAAGRAISGRRLSSRCSDYSSFDVFYFYCNLGYTGTYEIYSGNSSSIYKKLHVTVDKYLGAMVKGEVSAKKYGRDGVTSDVLAKFDLKIKCDSQNRYSYQGEDSYVSMDKVALAINNANKPGEKCTIGKLNLKGTIWVDGYEVVSMMKGHDNFYARTKQVEAEKLTLFKF